MKTAAIYARVSSDQQKEDKTIASQTATLVSYACSEGYAVPAEWIFEDEGVSGATLIRPGLERVRDLVAEGQIQAVLVLSPDRLSRKYAYPGLAYRRMAASRRAGSLRQCTEVELARRPTALAVPRHDRRVRACPDPRAFAPRQAASRQARRGQRAVQCRTYGYRYVHKTQDRAAYFEIIDDQAAVVRQVFEMYTAAPPRASVRSRADSPRWVCPRRGREHACWERSTVWGMLRNPAYRGMACFGKTQESARQRRSSPETVRLREKPPRRGARTQHETPREQWIRIPVPALVDERTFDLARSSSKRRASLPLHDKHLA